MLPWSHTGAIFCGGKSRRMNRPKAGIVLPSGMTMIEHVYKALKIVCRQVVLVGHCEGAPDSLKHLKRIDDNYHDQGPMGGLEALLSSGLDTEYLVSPCDVVKITPKVFALLTSPGISPPAVIRYKDQMEPLIGLYPTTLLPLVRGHIREGTLAVHELVLRSKAQFVDVPDEFGEALRNVNTADDMDSLSL